MTLFFRRADWYNPAVYLDLRAGLDTSVQVSFGGDSEFASYRSTRSMRDVSSALFGDTIIATSLHVDLYRTTQSELLTAEEMKHKYALLLSRPVIMVKLEDGDTWTAKRSAIKAALPDLLRSTGFFGTDAALQAQIEQKWQYAGEYSRRKLTGLTRCYTRRPGVVNALLSYRQYERDDEYFSHFRTSPLAHVRNWHTLEV